MSLVQEARAKGGEAKGARFDLLTVLARDSTFSYRYPMNSRHRKTLAAIFAEPVSASIPWGRIEALFEAIGAKTIEGSGSRVRFVLNDVVVSFHRPHPQKEAKPYQVRDAREFLAKAGVKP